MRVSVVMFAGLGAVVGLVHCTTTQSARTSSIDTAIKGCSFGVPGALGTFDETDEGVSLTILGPPDRVPELRERARHAAAIHGPGAGFGPGHEGQHGQGDGHGLQAMQLPPMRATVTDVEAGARIVLIPVDATDRARLATRAEDGVRRMNAAACR
jgi:hypothetical protein